MRDRQPLDALIAEDVDRAPIGELRHRQLSQPRERGPVIERGGEQRTGLGEEREPLAQGLFCRVQASPLERLRDLTADRGQRLEQSLVELADRAAEELDHPEPIAMGNQEKAHRRMQPGRHRRRGAREVAVPGHVDDIGGPARRPDPPRQPLAGRKRSLLAPSGELGETAAADRPHPGADEAVTLLVHPPERPVLPAHPLAQLAQQASDHLLLRLDLGQDPRDGSLSVEQRAEGRLPFDVSRPARTAVLQDDACHPE